MTKWKAAGFAVVAQIALFLGIGFVLPSEVTVTREAVINARPEAVYSYLTAPKKLIEWSPWAQRDPNAEWTFEGPESGVGAKYSWKGNDEVGAGSQTITAVVENKRVDTSLDFGAEGPATAWFALEPEGDNTKIIWGLKTEMGRPIGSWFGLLMDGMIGADYEQGLSTLKKLVEN